MTPDALIDLESMYETGIDRPGRERGADSDVMMFGFYIYNNTSIGFRTFASGLLFGIGSIFTLLYNGLYIGGAAGHLTYLGYGANLISFAIIVLVLLIRPQGFLVIRR